MFNREGDYEKLCYRINYQFRNPKLLAQAISTKSWWVESIRRPAIGHQEPLAFYGDSILRMVIDEILMDKFPHYSAGDFSKMRDLVVRDANLIDAARRLTLQAFIKMDEHQRHQCETSHPKLLADTMKAIICAIYKDSGNNLDEVKKFILDNSNITLALAQYQEDEQQCCMPLIAAIRRIDIAEVKRLLNQGVPVNSIIARTHYRSVVGLCNTDVIKQKQFLTPLGYAIDRLKLIASKQKNTIPMQNIIACLLDKGANINLTPKGELPLITQLISPISFEGYHANLWFARISQENNFNILSNTLDESLVPDWGVITDKVLKLFCDYSKDLFVDDGKETLLGLAIIFKQNYKIELLLHHGVNINQPNSRGETPLHLAAEIATLRVVQKLLLAKANPNLYNDDGLRPFDIAHTSEIKQALLKAEIVHGYAGNEDLIDIDELNHKAIRFYQEGVEGRSPEKLIQAIHLFSIILKQELSKGNYESARLVIHFYNLGTAYFQCRDYLNAKPFLERAYVLHSINEETLSLRTIKYFNRLSECKDKIERNTHVNPSITCFVVPISPPFYFATVYPLSCLPLQYYLF